MDSKGKERRTSPRLPVFAGNAEINDIMGRRPPRERARIVNWSRGGMLLRVPSPRRRFVFFKLEPAIRLADELACTLRLPPQYNDIKVEGAVVRVERAKDDADLLEVGVRFDGATNPAVIESMARLLEPRLRAPSVRLPAIDSKKSQRLEKKASQRLEKASSQRLEKASSQRLEKASSQRLEKASSQRLERASSQRLEKKASQRLEKKASQRLEKRASQRLEKGTSERVAQVDAPPNASRRLSMVQDETIEVRQSTSARHSGRLGRV